MSIEQAAKIIKQAKRVTAFTGAGISVESGIPPFRGEDGLWSKYDPRLFDISFFKSNTKKSWELIRNVFFESFGDAEPNRAHTGLAEMEQEGYLAAIITQNIDNLHQKAGSRTVYEFHGNSRRLVCLDCGNKVAVTEVALENLPPHCEECGGIYKPDFVFFGEPIPEPARSKSFRESEIADVFLVIGSTGEVAPASQIPFLAKYNGAQIIEINIKHSNFTNDITDIFLEGKASVIVDKLVKQPG